MEPSSKEFARDVDVVISCEDLCCEYLDYLVSMLNVPLLYVPGNHDNDLPSFRYKSGPNTYNEK